MATLTAPDMGYRPRPDLLAERVILVTGAGRGIGEVCAKTLAQHGATVILCGRNLPALEVVYDQICQLDSSAQPMILPLDLEHINDIDCEAVATAVISRFGKLHGLVHNAAVLGPRVPLAYYPLAEFNKVMQINLTANLLLTQALLPAMTAAPDASVIFTSSGVGRKTSAYWGAYSISKFGVEALMGIWSDELENLGQVRFNSLDPGRIRTKMRSQAYPAEDPSTLITAAEIMPIYLYLLGPDSLAVNGQQISARDWQAPKH